MDNSTGTGDVSKTDQTPPISTTSGSNIMRSSEDDGGNTVAAQAPPLTASNEREEVTRSQDGIAGKGVPEQYLIPEKDVKSPDLTERDVVSQAMELPLDLETLDPESDFRKVTVDQESYIRPSQGRPVGSGLHPNLPTRIKEMVESQANPEGTSIHSLAVEETHPQAAEIIRQVEYYLSDGNLATDAYLLPSTGVHGTGWTSLNKIFGFKKMKQYKPPRLAKAALRGSTVLEVDAKLKNVRRRTALTVPVQIIPKKSDESRKAQILIEKPWLTKNMLKQTGFEAGITEGPMRPEEAEAERQLFDPNEAFTTRIDHGIARYMSKRKMHQENLRVFSKYLLFGGFDGNQRQFTGGFDETDLENYTKDEIMQMKATFGVSERVWDGLEDDQEGGATWIVDFEGMTKAFFSSHLLQHFVWTDKAVTDNAADIITNFLNYLLYHGVCPEYEDELLKARHVCAAARHELPKLAAASRNLPGDFNTACSTLLDGYSAGRRILDPNAPWVHRDDPTGMSIVSAKNIYHTALLAHCSDEHYAQFVQADNNGTLTSTDEHQTGLEVVELQLPNDQVKSLYKEASSNNDIIHPTGKLICKRWVARGPPRLDIPKEVIARREASMPKRYDFLVDENVLSSCYVGLKLEATVMKFNVGDISYIDRVQYVYPSFFTWTLNECVPEFARSGPPKDWMVRQNERNMSDDGSERAETDADGKTIAEHAGGEASEVGNGHEESTAPADEETPD